MRVIKGLLMVGFGVFVIVSVTIAFFVWLVGVMP